MDNEAEVFRVRLNCVDYYQNLPTSLDPPIFGPDAAASTQRSKLPQVPVIRVFGATETGQKVCAHIHGAFPYLYVPYTESVEKSHVHSYISTFRHSIDHALALSYRRNPYDDPRNAAFVAHISLVKGVPFFGYNVGYKYFLKVYLLNPLHMTRFTDLLLQGAILKQTFQPYEAHLQYLLQWMCDFNLYGCAYIETQKPFFRDPIPVWEDLEDPDHRWHDRSIPADHVSDVDKYPRQSHCQLELDIRVEDILNRNSIQARPLHHSFIERLASLENLPPEEKLVHSMAGLWKDETRRRKLRMGLTDPSSSPFPPEVLISMSADPRNISDGGWIHEAEFRNTVAELAQQERRARGGSDLSFEAFNQHSDVDDGVQTVLQSVEDLFQSTMERKWKANSGDIVVNFASPASQFAGSASENTKTIDTVLVDASRVAMTLQDEEYDSDEEAAKERAFTQRARLEDAGIAEAVGPDAKVNGTSKDIELAAECLDDDTAVPLHPTALQISTSSKRSAPENSQIPFKRSRIEEHGILSRRSVFRVKDARRPQSVDRTDRSPPGAQLPRVEVNRDASDEPPPSAQPASSQRSATASQDIKSAFSIVKNGHEAGTVLRLSQRSASKHSPKKPSDKSESTSFDKISISPSKTSSLTTPQIGSQNRASIEPVLQKHYRDVFDIPETSHLFVFDAVPPSYEEVESSVSPSVVYQDAYFSKEKDVPERAREYAGQEFRLHSNTVPYLNPFAMRGAPELSKGIPLSKVAAKLQERRRAKQCTIRSWEILAQPPTAEEVEQWLVERPCKPMIPADASTAQVPAPEAKLKRKNRPDKELSQIEGPTQKNKHGVKFSQKKASTSVQHETGYMSIMSLEIHVNSRGDLAPDPEKDEVNLIVYCITDEQMEEDSRLGVALLTKDGDDDQMERIRRMVGNDVQVDAEDTELDLLNRMVDIVRAYDPDVLTGYEVHNSSWGYLIERARLIYEYNLPDEFSRMKSQSHGRFGKDADRWGFTHTSTVRITGRHTINVWRAMRSELNLLQYTMENVVFHLLHKRIPHYSFATLTRWYQSPRPKDLAKVLEYLITRTRLDLDILDANELIPRTSEQARLLGVDFFSVFSRGSQFKVESLMFRIAKPESFVLVSPSRKQVGAQNALECLPLVMEPQSAFYNSPLLVLDFQSLYPSVMIAYNYCYSTCLGRVVNWRGTNKLGFADFQRAPGLLELVQDKLNIAPNGMMYVKPEMRKSLLAKMLGEILETRVMVKSGMKVDKDDKTLQQLLNNRQLALKLIANVTYGYTSASFSGRMPCSEIADSIVQTARETLEKAIALIHSVERWGAEVVYGDTDSLFVYLKGRTRDDAFKIGDEIAKAVTDTNPRPVKLKFEKVYHPCVLLAKKRYVGFKYESPTQKEPEFDAKGIETVRRDGTPAEQKMEEKALKLLFRTSDLSEVKSYFQAQCAKIMSGKFSIQDFCFAKEVKLGTYADKGPPPPGALIATRRMLRDPRAEPQYGERVPYVVIAGAPGARLWERCVEPERLINDEHAELDAEYYINKNLIPPLERIFNLVGANVRQWYDEMPKMQRIRLLGGPRDGETVGKNVRKTMESYMGSSHCLVCRTKLAPLAMQNGSADTVELPLCQQCRYVDTQRSMLALRQRLRKAQAQARDLEDVCRSCANIPWSESVQCESRDCPVFYSRVKAKTRLRIAETSVGTVLDALQVEEGERRTFEW